MSGSASASVLGGGVPGSAAGNFLTCGTACLAPIFSVLCALLALVSAKSDMASQQSDLRNELIIQGDVASQSAIPGATGEATDTPTVPETK